MNANPESESPQVTAQPREPSVSDIKLPDRIWLQPDTDGETTWCNHRIDDDDVEYVRSPLSPVGPQPGFQMSERDTLAGELEQMADDIDDFGVLDMGVPANRAALVRRAAVLLRSPNDAKHGSNAA